MTCLVKKEEIQLYVIVHRSQLKVMLGFKPQKEIVYNRLLPYKDKLDEESNKFLSEIKYSLGRAVVFKETSPGILYWSNRLTK